ICSVRQGPRAQHLSESDRHRHVPCWRSRGMISMAQPDPFLEHFVPGANAAMQRLRQTIALINRRYKNPPHMGRSILLVGETGVGKNHVARVIAGHLYWLRDPGLWQPP